MPHDKGVLLWKDRYFLSAILASHLGLGIAPLAKAQIRHETVEPIRIQHTSRILEEAKSSDMVDRERKLLQLKQAASLAPVGPDSAAANAAWILGLIYLHGAGEPVDTATAQMWFQRAAMSRMQPWAFAGLAWCYMSGCQGAPDWELANAAIRMLRATHPARADYLQWLVATRKNADTSFLQPPFGAAKPESAHADNNAAALLKAAASRGDAQALVELGLDAAARQQTDAAYAYFRNAAGISPAARNNVEWLQQKKSATAISKRPYPSASSSKDALYAAARKNHRGEGRPANYTEAIRLYRQASARGSVPARKMLELIYSQPAPEGNIDIAWMQQLANVYPSAQKTVIQIGNGPPMLQRDPTPLFDLLPPYWQKQVTRISN